MNLRHPFVFIGGILFGFGLAISGMTKPEVVLSFLQLRDLGLLFVLGGAAVVVMIAINIVPRIMEKPVIQGTFTKRKRAFNTKVIIGAIIFGIGWGISGLCPGSAVSSIGVGNYPILIGILTLFLGAYIHGIIADKLAK